MRAILVGAFAAMIAAAPLLAAPPADTVGKVVPGQGPRRLALPVPATEEEGQELLLADAALRQTLESLGPGWRATFDRRSGRPLFLEGPGVPWVALSADGTRASRAASSPAVAARTWLGRGGRGLGLAAGALSAAQDDPPEPDRELSLITFRSVPLLGRIGSEGRLTFVVNHGNVVQIDMEWLHDRRHALVPALDAAEAWRRVRAATEVPESARHEAPELRSVDLASTDEPSGIYTGPVGRGYDTRLAWVFRFAIPGDVRTLVAQVDAQTGELLDLFDDNRYGHVSGGVYPRSSSEGAETSLPFAGVAVSNGGAKTTDLGGSYTYSAGTASTALGGAHFAIGDACGAPAASSTADPGDLDLGLSTSTDCTFSPEGHSTRSARNAFYHLGNVRRLGQKWLGGMNAKADSWFASNVGANVNISQTCNAYWDGSTVNFFRSGGGCANSGEIGDVMQHEWGHGLDTNTKSGSVGDSAKGEAVADGVAALITRDNCIGPGFLPAGGGETSTCPTAVRDLALVVTRANIASLCSRSFGCTGALGYECHCESHLLSGAYWRLAALFVQTYGEEDGWNRFERGYLLALQNTTSYLAGSAGNAYDAWMAGDDDNGNITDGTPNADIIFEAFNAQGLAGTQRVKNVVACATLPQSPQVTAVAGVERVELSWSPVAGAGTYAVFRADPLVNVFLPVASGLTSTSYADLQVAGGFTYRYQVVALRPAAGSGQCASAYGAGVAATPTRGTGVSDFSVALSPTSSSVIVGGSTTVTVGTSVLSGSASTIALSVAGLPAGVTGSFNPTSVTAGGSSTLTLSAAANAPLGTANYTVTGVSGSTTHSASGALAVSAPILNDFSLAISPASVSVGAGSSATASVSSAVTSGAAQTISLSVSGLPAGVTGSFSPTSVTAGGSSTLTLTAAANAAAGSATAVVTGTAASGSHTASLSVTVTPGGLVNGNFEWGTLQGWTPTGAAGITNAAHSGSYAALVGSTAPTSGDSSIAQTFIAPLAGGKLSFWYQVRCPDTVSYDWATVRLRDNAAGTTKTVLPKTCTNDQAWKQASALLQGGRSYTLTLTSHDDNFPGDATSVRFDDVVITARGIVNGGFDTGTFEGWSQLGSTAITTVNYQGGYAAVLGSPSPTNGNSSVSQTFAVPAGSTRISMYYANNCPDTVTDDWARITLKDNTTGSTRRLLPKTCASQFVWTHLSAHVVAGHTYTLTATSHDDNDPGDATYTLLDNVTLKQVVASQP